MIPEYHPLELARHLDLGAAAPDRLHLAHAGLQDASVDVPASSWSLWLPLRGELQMECAHGHWRLPRRHLLVAREALQGHAGATTGAWLVLAGSQAAWHAALRTIAPQQQGWLPRQCPCPQPLLRKFVQLARRMRDGDATGEAALHPLCLALLEHERDLQPLADRCNGRTPQRRYQTLQRLLRVHQLIERDDDGHLDLAQLSRFASYSPWHLIRMYREVFGETPSEHVARRRLARAWSMVRDSALPVCEITEKLGFESQSAFCRAFKNAYGLTTTQARHLPATAPRLLTPRPAHARARSPHARRQQNALQR